MDFIETTTTACRAGELWVGTKVRHDAGTVAVRMIVDPAATPLPGSALVVGYQR